MTDTDPTRAFAEAVEAAMSRKGVRTQGQLGELVAAAEGRDHPYKQGDISDRLTGRRGMKPQWVFALERALDLDPGELSQILGYLPLEAIETYTVAAALAR